MKTILSLSITAFLLMGFTQQPTQKPVPPKSFHELSVLGIDGKTTISFKDFAGKKVLLVNTASMCGYTGQYKGLQDLYKKYEGKLVVIAFPCNQFAEQEPWDNQKIQTFCKGRFDVSFPMTDKVDVKGENQHIVYQWLTQKKFNGKEDINVRWNFGKFLIDEKGKFIQYFPSQVDPMDAQITQLIEGKK